MLKNEDYLGKDAVELSAGIRAGNYSVAEVTECAINRAEKVESSIHSIVTENFEQALVTAKKIDNSPEYLQKSILAGFPFSHQRFEHCKRATRHLWQQSF